MASNRGPSAIGSSSSPSSSEQHQNSEYYRARNSGGTAFQWAGAGGAGGGTPGGTSSGVSSGSGVGGSWASVTNHAPPPTTAPPAPPQVSVSGRSPAGAYAAAVSAIPISNMGASSPAGVYERNLIQELCPPGGMKAEPPQDKLEELARSVPSLNPDWVCPALLDALEEGNPWIMRAKALCVIETVLRVTSEVSGEGGSNAYADFFHACAGEIEPLANHARAAVKGPAKRVLAALGVAVSEGEGVVVNGGQTGSRGVAASTNAADAPNLLDFDEPAQAATTVTEAVAPPAPAVNASGGESLFSGLNTKASLPATTPAPAPVSQEDDLLGGIDGLSAKAAPATQESTAESNDLFGNMNVKSAEVKVEAQTSHITVVSVTITLYHFGVVKGYIEPFLCRMFFT